MDVSSLILKTKEASKKLNIVSNENREKALNNIAEALKENMDLIIKANELDLKENEGKISDVMYKRLLLNEKKINDIINSIYDVIKLDNPVGEVIETIKRDNGLVIEKVRVPFGLLACIYESRPNVTVDIAVLALKTGNACILKGGKEAKNTNTILVDIMKRAISKYLPSDSIALLLDRKDTMEVITNKNVDLVIPRGSKGLINFVIENAKVPAIETGAGVCHLFIDETADDNMALEVAYNAKLSNPAVCNAIETILVHEKKAYLLKDLKEKLKDVKFRGNKDAQKYIDCELMDDNEYNTEYDDLIVSIKVVKDIDEALAHIDKYSTHHSEAIITNDDNNALRFLNEIDSACIYVNASTRFTDGGCFGFGAEIGISTGKLHARGPMGLKEITSYKYKIRGNGQVR